LCFAFLIEVWGANSCSGTTNVILTSASNTYTINGSTDSTGDNYYFTVSGPGAVTVTTTTNNNMVLTTSKTACPLNSGGSASQVITLDASDLDFNIKVFRSSGGSTNKNYTLTATFTPVNNVRNFTVAYQTNDLGNIKIIGNSVVVGGANNACPGNTIRNNSINVVYANIDSANTYNSSSATLAMPSGSTVKWAGLYWQGYAPDYNSTMRQIKFKAPNMTPYQSLSSDNAKFNWVYFGSGRYMYQGAIDITNYVRTAGNGDYIVGNIATQTGQPAGGSFGAWSIIVVYRDATDTLKNLTVFDGYQAISQSDASNPNVYTTLAIPLSGFLTPPNGTVSSSFYMFVGEGDIGATGDSVSLTNKLGTASYISNALNPWNDIMNSSITDNGSYVTTRNPQCQNTIGIDIDNFNVGNTPGALGIIGNNQTSTTATFTSAGDGYFPGAAAFATQIYQPFIYIDKQANTSGILQPSSTISYRATMTNSGQEAASNIKVYDDFTANQLYTTDGNLTSPPVYLSDVIDRNATKILNGIRLTDVNGSTMSHCPVGVTGASCVYSDANCSVDYIGDPATTASKIWCNIPRLDINASLVMTFSLDISSNATQNTQNQDINVLNTMNASYYNALTGEAVAQTASSNAAAAGLINGAVRDFNAWETTYQSFGSPKIYTKLASTQFSLSVGASATFNGGVCAAVVDSNGNILTGGAYQCKDFSTTSMPFAWTVTQAQKTARISIKWKSGIQTNGVVPSSWSGWSDNASNTDTFAIRPQYLSVSTAMPLLQKAGDDANKIAISTNTPGYDQSLSSLTLSISRWLNIDGTNLNNTPPTVTGLTMNGSTFDSVTGNTKNNDASFVFGDVGRFLVDINDTAWASSSGDIAGGDCIATSADYNVANTLTNGKYGCYVMLNPQNGVDLRFIPYQFNISNDVLSNASNGFTYFSKDLSLSAATIPMTITAANKNGITTLNYTDGFYSRAFTITPTGLQSSGYTLISNPVNSKFLSGVLDLSLPSSVFKFNFDRSIATPLAPLTIKGTDVTLSISDADNVTGGGTASGSANFLYGKIAMPDTMVDYAVGGSNVRAFAEVYATSQPPSCPGCVQAPGSANWWINSLDSASTIPQIFIKNSDVLTSLSNDGGGASNTALVAAGVASISISPTTNQDQKLKLHLDVPSYLWFSPSNTAYDFSAGSDCSKHPCAWIDIFGTNVDTNWYGSGDKGNQTVQTVPKGKRKPKVNW
jgi:hypothetical protein